LITTHIQNFSVLFEALSLAMNQTEFSIKTRSKQMLKWAIIFAIISFISGVFGFRSTSAGTASIAKFLFFLFALITLVLLVLGLLGIGVVA